MAETMNRNIQLTVARVEAPAMLDDADALRPCHAGCEGGNRLILLAD